MALFDRRHVVAVCDKIGINVRSSEKFKKNLKSVWFEFLAEHALEQITMIAFG